MKGELKQKVLDKVKELGCEVEYVVAGDYQDCLEGKKYPEIIAPAGLMFDDGLHSVICFGWRDAWSRIKDAKLVKDEDVT